ncbi:hypothetical protein M409DRAFT_37413 [Zasmidium cellare ATCC 36951]|uniref:Uncharacterized protein n=1 Tax=Zasmidium cellare ATCC 36951 TaxID=1080233 RepID=A0A6A6C6E9_ZASCE|nr:uncharacterized protein M409DRAFT_37413 [Zasmidium cellare ATCC 36951]KAF2162453.1 hypothetical protein M409DRAFT_37413 [Zasmidium cellare ATCC 36951]
MTNSNFSNRQDITPSHTGDPTPYSRSTPDASTSDEFLERALNFTQQPAPQQINPQRLRQPVAIPQVIPGLGQPYARAYSHELKEHGVSMEDFVKFIDNLNVVSAGSPPLQIVDLAGGVVGMIPFAHAQLISFGIQTVAKVGVAAVSKTRGSMFLSKSNTAFFNPRGLKVELVTTEALRYKLRIPPDASAPADDIHSNDMGLIERRMAMLKGYAAPVTFDVPPPDQQTNILNNMSAAQQKRVLAKQEQKFQKERAKDWAQSGSSGNNVKRGDSRENEDISKKQRKVDKINDELDRKLAKKPKDASKIERERSKDIEKVEKDARKELEKMDKDRYKDSGKSKKEESKKAEKETKAMNKIQWILIESLH